MDTPLVSIVIAVKNAERYLIQALDSVERQTYSVRETIVVDGQSTDGSLRIVQSYPRVRCVPQVGNGLANAWNIGIDAARGQFIAFLDSDDLWPPHKLALQIEHFVGDPVSDCVV